MKLPELPDYASSRDTIRDSDFPYIYVGITPLPEHITEYVRTNPKLFSGYHCCSRAISWDYTNFNTSSPRELPTSPGLHILIDLSFQNNPKRKSLVIAEIEELGDQFNSREVIHDF